jgi:hypothetical protein
MQIVDSIAALEKVIDLCRAKRVMSISVDGVSMQFHPAAFIEPDPPSDKPKKKGQPTETINGQPIDEDILFHSSGPPPDEDA